MHLSTYQGLNNLLPSVGAILAAGGKEEGKPDTDLVLPTPVVGRHPPAMPVGMPSHTGTRALGKACGLLRAFNTGA